jgi:hypothetical protein
VSQKQPFRNNLLKKVGPKHNLLKKVGPKHNLLKKVGPKHNLLKKVGPKLTCKVMYAYAQLFQVDFWSNLFLKGC